jgi:hypothetical protein
MSVVPHLNQFEVDEFVLNDDLSEGTHIGDNLGIKRSNQRRLTEMPKVGHPK